MEPSEMFKEQSIDPFAKHAVFSGFCIKLSPPWTGRDLPKNGFFHLINGCSLSLGSAHKLNDGLILRRASQAECEALREASRGLGGPRNLPLLNAQSASSRVENEHGLDAEQAVAVVECVQHLPQVELTRLTRALLTAQFPLFLGMFIGRSEGPWVPAVATPLLGSVVRDTAAVRGIVKLDERVAIDISQHLQAVTGHDNSTFDLEFALESIEGAHLLPYSAPLTFLAFFAILESILTHHPKPSDPYDSITRQVSRKVNLLSKRFDVPISPNEYFGKISDIWPKLYKYRSLLAHGRKPDFKGELQTLKNSSSALYFVHDVVRAIIRQALKEPLLLADLRDC